MISERHRAEFEQLGIEAVRVRARQAIWGEEKQRAANFWLDEKEHGEERQHRRDNLAIARSAKNAAWAAAGAALVAAIFAGISIALNLQ